MNPVEDKLSTLVQAGQDDDYDDELSTVSDQFIIIITINIMITMIINIMMIMIIKTINIMIINIMTMIHLSRTMRCFSTLPTGTSRQKLLCSSGEIFFYNKHK